MNDIRTERADLDAIRAWERAERAAQRQAATRTAANVAVTFLAAAAAVWLLRH